jgi:hypothetical protein
MESRVRFLPFFPFSAILPFLTLHPHLFFVSSILLPLFLFITPHTLLLPSLFHLLSLISFFTPHPSPHHIFSFVIATDWSVFIFYIDNHLNEDSTMNVKIEMDEEDLDEEEEELQSD